MGLYYSLHFTLALTCSYAAISTVLRNYQPACPDCADRPVTADGPALVRYSFES